MKKFCNILIVAIMSTGLFGCYDDSGLWDAFNDLEDRVTNIETQLSEMNKDLSNLSAIVNALQNKVYVSSINETENGYTITFTDGKTITITNGKDGQTPFIGEDGNWWIGDTNTGVSAEGITPRIGEDGNWWIGQTNTGIPATGADGKDAPIISIEEFEGKYYWVQIINGTKSWLLDKDGNKIPVTGEDAVTPILRVNAAGYWIISYDHGITFTEILDESGNPIKAVGQDGDAFFKTVYIENDTLILILLDGTVIKIPLVKSTTSLDTIIEVTDNIGNWDNGYVTSYGYFLYSEDFMEPDVTQSRDKDQSCLSFLSTDEKTQAVVTFSKNEKLPLQIVLNDEILNFSYLDDSLLELVYCNGSEMKIVQSITFSLEEMENIVYTLGYKSDLKRALYYIYSLIYTSLDEYSSFKELISMFEAVLKLEFSNDSDAINDFGMDKINGMWDFVDKSNDGYTIIIVKIYHYIVMWTGEASFKVGGSSCTLRGTIWCPSSEFNAYGTYGIVCDTDRDNLTTDKAEYVGTGFQDPQSLSYEVDFRGLKPNTRYYYRAYYEFNSSNHGNLKFMHGDQNAEIGYDYVIKYFDTGDNNLNVDVVMCIDGTGSMGSLISTVKRNAISFYDSFNAACTDAGIGLLSLNTQVIAFRDINVDGSIWLQESPVYSMPEERTEFQNFVNNLRATGGGDTPESGLEALDLAFSNLTDGVDDGYHRQVVILWTDAPYLVGSSYTDLTLEDISASWSSLPSGRRLIIFAPTDTYYYSNGGNWGNFDDWKNVIHSTDISSSFSDFDYILEAIIGELTGRGRSYSCGNSVAIPLGTKN